MLWRNLFWLYVVYSFRFHGDANAVDLYQHKNKKILIQKQHKKWSQYPFKTIQEMKHSDKVLLY